MDSLFPTLIINARPAAGKSEVLAYLNALDDRDRAQRFHIGNMQVFDDFPILWGWFEEDDLLERVFHRPRLHTTSDSYFREDDYWHLLVRRLGLNYEKWHRDAAPGATAVIEFSRGAGSGGYAAAYRHLPPALLDTASVLYIRVSYEESLRKNRRRMNPERLDSILEHSLPDDKMERLYRADDFAELAAGDAAFLHLNDHRVPYVIFDNEDDLTTAGGEPLGERLETCLADLWERRRAR